MSTPEKSAPTGSGPNPQVSQEPSQATGAAPGQTSPVRFNFAESAMRLVVGSALIGSEEVARRLRFWEQQLMTEARAVTNQPASDQDRVRYALIGFLFLARQSAGRELNQAVNQYQRHNPGRELSKALNLVAGSRLLSPVVKPLRSQFDTLTRRWGDDVEHWVRIGRIEERNSRSLANKATGELIDEVIAYLAQNPAITGLVQQQGVGLAGEVIDTARQTTAAADDIVEGIIWRILRRPPRALSTSNSAHDNQALSKDGNSHD